MPHLRSTGIDRSKRVESKLVVRHSTPSAVEILREPVSNLGKCAPKLRQPLTDYEAVSDRQLSTGLD